MEQKIHTFKDLPIGMVQDRFISEMDERIEDVGWNDLEVKKGSEKLKAIGEKKREVGKIMRDGTKFVGAYHGQASPRIQPEVVEHPFELQPEGFPVKVVGRIDVIASVDGSPPKIIDRKRRGSFNKKPEPEWVVQGRIYQLVREIPHEWHITFTRSGEIRMGGDAYTIQPEPRWKSEKLLSHTIGEVGYFMSRYGPDEPWPARGQLHTWACNYCAFKDDKTCWFYKEA
jgi:hypothetical protein